MRRFRRSLAVFTASFVSVTVVGVLAPGAASAHDETQAPTELKLRAGMNDPEDPNIAVLEFLPEKIRVVTGEQVTWTFDGPEPHSVTFVAPGSPVPSAETDPSLFGPAPATAPFDGTTLVNSGVLPVGAPTTAPTFSMSFGTPGDYTYYCVLHPNMVGTVTVGTDDVNSQAEVDAAAQEESAEYLAEGRAAKKKLSAIKPKGTKNRDGSTTWRVVMGVSTAHTDVLGFSRPPTKLAAGDSVTFVNNSAAPHTASFGGALVPQDPRAPDVLQPVPGPTPQALTAGSYFNTGWLPPKSGPTGPPRATRSYTYSIADPGRYEFVCVLHLPSGMAAALDVRT